MDSENLKQLKEYAVKRKELLDSIYDITHGKRFSGEQQEIDGFEEFLNMREPYCEELSEINKNIKDIGDFKIDFNSGDALYREISQILNAAESVAVKIMEIDKKNNRNMQQLADGLKAEVKNINVSKKARNSYNFFQMQAGQNENAPPYGYK
jgi:hypothetical protein